jgi:hypothetical protein
MNAARLAPSLFSIAVRTAPFPDNLRFEVLSSKHCIHEQLQR